MIELDVQLTRDRRLVVLHDLALGRTVAKSGWVRDYDLATLQSNDAGTWFDPAYSAEHVLSLDEVLDLTGQHTALNVEIKSPQTDWQPTAEVLIALLAQRAVSASTIISSFDIGALRWVRAVEPRARIGVLWQSEDLEPAWSHVAALGAGSLHLWWGLVDDRVLAESRHRGLPILAWTVNDIEVMRRLVRGGVGGVISDFPERFASLE